MLFNRTLSKKFKLIFLTSFLCLSCVKQEQSVIIKVGARAWTLEEVQDYFQARIKSYSVEEASPENIKKELLNEIFFRSLVENWAKNQKKKAQAVKLSEEEKILFLKDTSQLKALKDHKNYLSLYSLLMKELSEQIKAVSVAEQKDFYNKNKSLFFVSERCHLKQIVVEKEKLARSLRQKIKQGEAFDKLNKLYSLKKHPGWIKKGDLKVFDQACFYQKESLSPVLKSPYGYHIFIVEGKKPSQQKPFPAVQKQIIQIFKQKEAKEKFQIWLKKEISKTPIWTNKKLLNKIHIQYTNNST